MSWAARTSQPSPARRRRQRRGNGQPRGGEAPGGRRSGRAAGAQPAAAAVAGHGARGRSRQLRRPRQPAGEGRAEGGGDAPRPVPEPDFARSGEIGNKLAGKAPKTQPSKPDRVCVDTFVGSFSLQRSGQQRKVYICCCCRRALWQRAAKKRMGDEKEGAEEEFPPWRRCLKLVSGSSFPSVRSERLAPRSPSAPLRSSPCPRHWGDPAGLPGTRAGPPGAAGSAPAAGRDRPERRTSAGTPAGCTAAPVNMREKQLSGRGWG